MGQLLSFYRAQHHQPLVMCRKIAHFGLNFCAQVLRPPESVYCSISVIWIKSWITIRKEDFITDPGSYMSSNRTSGSIFDSVPSKGISAGHKTRSSACHSWSRLGLTASNLLPWWYPHHLLWGFSISRGLCESCLQGHPQMLDTAMFELESRYDTEWFWKFGKLLILVKI